MDLLAITNAHARGVVKSGSALSPRSLPAGAKHHLTHAPSDLQQVLALAAQENLRHLVIEGGDGTVRTVMSALLNHYADDQALPAVSILPSGTTNQIARNLGVKKASDIARIHAGGLKALTLPLIKVTSRDMETRYGFLFSTGALPHVSRFAQDEFNARGGGGGKAVVGGVLKVFLSDKDTLMPPRKLRLKGRCADTVITQHKGKALGTIMTTLPSLMLGLYPFWGTEDAPLRLTWAEAESQKLGRTIAGLWAGRKQDRSLSGYHSHNLDRLSLKTKALAALDGDFIDVSGQKLKISTSRPVTFWQAA